MEPTRREANLNLIVSGFQDLVCGVDVDGNNDHSNI